MDELVSTEQTASSKGPDTLDILMAGGLALFLLLLPFHLHDD